MSLKLKTINNVLWLIYLFIYFFQLNLIYEKSFASALLHKHLNGSHEFWLQLRKCSFLAEEHPRLLYKQWNAGNPTPLVRLEKYECNGL